MRCDASSDDRATALSVIYLVFKVDVCNFVINEFNPTFVVQNMGNEAFQNASFGNA